MGVRNGSAPERIIGKIKETEIQPQRRINCGRSLQVDVRSTSLFSPSQKPHPLIPFLSISQSTMCSIGALSSVRGLYLSSYGLSLKFNWLNFAMF